MASVDFRTSDGELLDTLTINLQSVHLTGICRSRFDECVNVCVNKMMLLFTHIFFFKDLAFILVLSGLSV